VNLVDLPVGLEHLDVTRNLISSLDLLELNRLATLNISFNQFTELEDLPPSLLELYCQNNLLTYLNLEGLAQLKTLNVSNNKITVIENLPEAVVTLLVDNNPSIEFRNTPAVPKPAQGEGEGTGEGTGQRKLEYRDALNEYFKLKQKYDEKTYKLKRTAYDKAKPRKRNARRCYLSSPSV